MRCFFAFLVAALGLTACGPRATPAGYAGDDARDFVQKHRAPLQQEIAIGSGSRLRDLAVIADCQDIAALGRILHRRQADLFGPAGTPATPPDDAEVAERTVRLLSETPELRCLGLELGPGRAFAAGRRQIGPTRNDVLQHGAP